MPAVAGIAPNILANQVSQHAPATRRQHSTGPLPHTGGQRAGFLLCPQPITISAMTSRKGPEDHPPEVDPKDLRRYGKAAIGLAADLAPGESARWADLVNTAASMGEIE